MSQYSIKDLERISGIKAHTIRIWEQRYGILKPNRTDTNIRLYDNDDLKRMLSVGLLNQQGFKISRIIAMKEEEINDRVSKINVTVSTAPLRIDQLILSTIEMNENHFEDILNLCISANGFEKTFTEIVWPFMERIGVLWLTGSIRPAQEHFISNLVRQKLISAIDLLPRPSGDESIKSILFLPDTELHEISLLYTQYLYKKKGFRTIYLGQCVPFDDLQSIIQQHKPKELITILTCRLPNSTVEEYVDRIQNSFPDIPLYVSGYQIIEAKIKNRPKLTVFQNPSDLVNLSC